MNDRAKAQARGRAGRRVIAVHLVLTLYGHWAANDPRGSGSSDFIDLKFEPLGPIHFGRKPRDEQPSRKELKEFHAKHEEMLNFPIFWIDEPKRRAIAEAIDDVIRAAGYTCYACAICGNHVHLVIRTHKHDASTIWNAFAQGIRSRMTSTSSVESRFCFSNEISPHHPVISARPYKVFLYETDEVWDRIDYVEGNPLKERLPPQRWNFVSPYDNFPFHKKSNAPKARGKG